MKTSQECTTLGEYRTTVLAQPQVEVARRAKCQQGWITQVECGHLPRPWNRDRLLKAYELDGEEFERLVLNVKKVKALKEAETLPLWDFAVGEGQVEEIQTRKEVRIA